MGFTDWFALGMKRNKEVKVKKIKKQSVDMGTMVAGHPAEAALTLGRMMDQANAPTKVLMVQDGDYTHQVTGYAIKMAQRLDCEIIALDITDKPLQFSGDRQKRESDRFMEMAGKNFKRLCAETTARGIKVEHVMDIGKPEEIIAKISAADAGIRYVLTKPDKESLRANQEGAQVPVFDLHCSRL